MTGNHFARFLEWTHDLTPSEILERVDRYWWFAADIFPVPREGRGVELSVRVDGEPAELRLPWPRCVSCGSPDLVYSHVSFGAGGTRRGVAEGHDYESTYNWRAEPQLKCTSCGAKNYYGLPITQERYERLSDLGCGRSWRYRDIREYLRDPDAYLAARHGEG